MNNQRLGIIRQYAASFIVTTGMFGLGTVLAWTSPALPNIEASGDLGNVTYSEKAWVASMSMLGALAACPVAGVSVEKLGRKKTMIILAFPFILGWILIGMAPNIEMLYIGRFVTGFSAGGFSLIAPIFISEIAENHVRGILSSLVQLMMVLGILFTYVVGSYVTWQTLAFISSIFPALFLVMVYYIPETPRYCLAMNKFSETEKSLSWYRGTTDYESIQNEWLSWTAQNYEDSTKTKKIGLTIKKICSRNIIQPVLISLSLMVFEQVSGFNAVIFYTVDIFKAAGTEMNANLATTIVGIVQVISTIVSGLLVDRAGRRVLLILSEAVMTVSLLTLGLFFYFKSANNDVSPIGFEWLPLTSLLIFIIAFAQGIGPLSWTMMGEILPPHIKGACSSLATSLVWLFGFLVTVGYEHLLETVGIYWCFWMFAIFSAIGTIVVTLFVPETKGQSLEEIQSIFANHNKNSMRIYTMEKV